MKTRVAAPAGPTCRAPSSGRRLVLLLLLVVGGAAPGRLRGQGVEGLAAQAEVTAGSELENYLRTLQSLGEVPLYPWTIRAFSPAEIDRLAPGEGVGPWAGRYDLRPDSSAGPHFALLRPEVQAIYNSAFPSGGNDGPIWAGRGLTTAVQFGAAVRWGPVSAVLAPMAFWAQNADFELYPNGKSGPERYGAMRLPDYIDLPQRFGDGAFSVVDPGQSGLTVSGFGIVAGISTASQYWGPATEHPVLLGNNAAGFPHVFFGTEHPLDLWVARVHGRAVWGRLDQSEYSAVGGDGARLMTGVVASASPRYLEGLEIGVARFFHSFWPADGISARDLARPFEGLLKTGLDERFGRDPRMDADNQIAAVFARWTFPESGFELYGEFGREDHPWDLRNLLLRPDDASAYLIGFRKAWHTDAEQIVLLRGETLDTQISHLWRADPLRGQPWMYAHSEQRQGHTQRGQSLASRAAFGGGASVLALDMFRPWGRWTVGWQREMRGVAGYIDLPTAGTQDSGLDLVNSLSLQRLQFMGAAEVLLGVEASFETNRNFTGSDRPNLRASVSIRSRP